MDFFPPITIAQDQVGCTLAAVVRAHLRDLSWNQIKRLIEGRRAQVNSELCMDSARRLREGETVEVLARPAPRPWQAEAVTLRHVDEHVVVVEKPSGLNTVRHPLERDWKEQRRELAPTLDDIVAQLLAQRERRTKARLRIVHRLDKETSGLVVFARSVVAERGLGQQFHAQTATRRYLALIAGFLPAQKIASRLVRDRGDGRRGSITSSSEGKDAITHVEVVERFRGYTLLQCRLETGRTHQIRIHLAERGHPVCGDKVYSIRRDGSVLADNSGSPRLALHATELGFLHPQTNEALHWSMPLPVDLEQLLSRLRAGT
jgi:23S rRNA pseudouridine1911/1915/1917 synthase